MDQLSTLLVALGTTAVLLALTRALSSRRYRVRFPPGPKPSWFLGNFHDIPKERPWETYRDWSQKYGDIIGLKLPGNQAMIILNSPQAAFDLLDKRSKIYSDRPKSLVVDLVGWNWNTPLLPFGEEWRRTRRASMQHFIPKAMPKHLPVMEQESRRFLRLLQADPQHLKELLQFSFAATTLKCMYGIEVEPGDKSYVSLLHKALVGPTEFLMAGAFLVEYIPILQYVPAWVPGAGFQKKFAAWRNEVRDMLELPFAESKRTWARGEGYHSASHEMLDQISQAEMSPAQARDEERIAKIGAANAYAAGSDTTFSTLLSFFMAMAMYPEVQVKAQAELDAVVGLDRFPEHTDRDALPYVNAVVKESYRWENVLPLGVVHRCMEEDEYEGYSIPKGTLLFPNVWAMMHDPKVYPNPERFEPERYLRNGVLNPKAPNPADIVFGFGRRVCLGKNFAEASIFLNIASALHIFRITPPLNAEGHYQKVGVTMSTGFLSYPSGFKCDIQPRSPAAAALLQG